MTDGRIARLACTATVIADTGNQGRAAALAESLLRTSLPTALTEALGDAFADDPAVYLVRSLHCELTSAPAAPIGALARSLATRIVGAVRGPDPHAEDIVRFPTVAAYHAAFLAEHVSGDAGERWYFGPLRRLAALPPPAAFQALAAEGRDMSAVLLALYRSGALSKVMRAVGEQSLARTWPSFTPARPTRQEWLSLTRLARDLARTLGWQLRLPGDAAQPGSAPHGAAPHEGDLDAVAATLADQARQAAEDLDWTDPAALAAALARATWLLASPGTSGSQVTASQLPSWLDWADTQALLAALAAQPQPPGPLQEARTGAGETEETWSGRATAPDVPLPPRQPAVRSPRTAAVETLLADLIAAGTVVPDPGRPATSAIALWVALAGRMPALADAAWPRDLIIRYVHQLTAPARHAVPSGLAGPAGSAPPRMARPAAAPPAQAIAGAYCAGFFLLLRPLDAIRMPRLCRESSIPPAALLYRLARRWSGPAIPEAEIAAVLRLLTGGAPPESRGTASTWQRLLTAASAVAQAQLSATDLGPTAPGPSSGLAHAHDLDPRSDLALDLIAVIVLRHWAYWLRGFADASIPYLLDTFIRRPGLITVTAEGTLIVTMDRQPHDAVLDASGALAPLDLTWPWPPARPSGGPTAAASVPVRRIGFALVP